MTRQQKKSLFAFLRKAAKEGLVTALRWALLVSMILLLAFAGVWIFFVKTFNAQHLSEVIAAELQKRLQRPVAITSLNVTFINTMELKGFHV